MFWSSILLYSFFLCVGETFKQNDYIIKHEHAEFKYYNPRFFRNFEFRNVKPNRTYKAFSGNCELLEDLDGDSFKANLNIVKILDNIPKLPIADFDVKVCDSLEKNILGFSTVAASGNLTKCPIKKGYYYVKNTDMEAERMPPLLPAGRYRMNLTFKMNSTIIGKVSFFVELIYKMKY